MTDLTALRARAAAMFAAAVAAVDPAAALNRALDRAPPAPPGAGGGRRIVIAAGKAALPMARAAMARLAPDLVLVVTNPENAAPLPGAQVFAAGHPVPAAENSMPIRVHHATVDDVVPLQAAAEAIESLKAAGHAPSFKSHAGLGHSVNNEEIQDIFDWLSGIAP